MFALFFWKCCLYVGQSAFVVRVCFRRLIVLHLRVDNSLADSVYELVLEQEEQQQALNPFELEQDPNQSSEEPKAAEGKHRSMVPYLKLFYAPTVILLVHLRFQVLLETLVAFFPRKSPESLLVC